MQCKDVQTDLKPFLVAQYLINHENEAGPGKM